MNFDIQQFIADNQIMLFTALMGFIGLLLLFGGFFQWKWLVHDGITHRNWFTYLLHKWLGARGFYMLLGIIFISVSILFYILF